MAINYKILVYALENISAPFKDPIKTLASPQAANIGGGSESPHVVNAIKVCNILDKEILVSVSESGEICLWETERLDRPPQVLRNEQKTWGITIHEKQGLLAVSSNNWKIKIYNLLELTKSDPRFGQRSEQNMLNCTKEIELEGHEHNIPFIDFNDTGQYIASASIDGTAKVWDICSKQIVTEYKLPLLRNRESESW
ncbi:WD40-repeat-containing domain protein [Sporodiniella umbellata]|nr:WD40-repeat-containing domain protein [Sporodiniella umbellata]